MSDIQIIFLIEILPKFHYSLIQFSKFINFLWVYLFLGKNLSNLVPPVWKLCNPYCHNLRPPFFMVTSESRRCDSYITYKFKKDINLFVTKRYTLINCKYANLCLLSVFFHSQWSRLCLYVFFLPSSSMYFVACFLLCHSIRIEDQVDVGIVD